MSEYMINGSTLTAIADAIRAKAGMNDAMTPAQMAEAIAAIQAGGDDSTLREIIERTATDIMLPSDLTTIGDYVFRGCTNLALTSLPSGVKEIGEYAFYNCTALAFTSLPESLTYIGGRAFLGCSNLRLTELPEKLTYIGEYAFKDCSNLALKKLPDELANILGHTFMNCDGLMQIEIPSRMASIGYQAFYNCDNLTEVTFKGTPTGTINSLAFSDCTNLLTINVPWAEGAVTNAPWGATNATINYNYTEEA